MRSLGHADPVKAAMGERIARVMSPPEVLSEGYDRMLAVAQALQGGVGAIALAAVWILPPADRHATLLVTGLLIGVYLPWTVLSRRTAALSDGVVARALNLAMDLLALAAFALMIPPTRLAVMFAYTLVVAFHAYVSGRVAGIAMAAASLGLVGVAEWRVPPPERLDAFTIVIYAAVTVALAVMVDALAAERRRSARHLARLHRALEGLATDPALSATTDSIAEAAQQAVGATAVMVLLPRDDAPDELQVVGGAGLPDDLRALLRKALRRPDHSPSGMAMRDGRIVTVADLSADARFAWAAPTLARYDARSIVAVPLGPPDDPIGVLNAYFARVGAFDEDDVELLTAYARQASVTVARALAFEKVAETDRLKSRFVEGVSHELGTPLTSIVGFLGTVLDRWDQMPDDVKKDSLQRAASNAAEIRRLREQILTFSSLAEGHHPGTPQPYPLRDGIDEIVANLEPALHGAPVDVAIAEDLAVASPPEAMGHVIGNLLTNAAKFSPAGSPIRVEAQRRGPMAEIVVIDEGPGVPPEERRRVFDRFYRGSTAVNARGTGIGLAIVKSSVEALGGAVDLRDGDGGRGAAFVVTLPLADAPVAAPAEALR